MYTEQPSQRVILTCEPHLWNYFDRKDITVNSFNSNVISHVQGSKSLKNVNDVTVTWQNYGYIIICSSFRVIISVLLVYDTIIRNTCCFILKLNVIYFVYFLSIYWCTLRVYLIFIYSCVCPYLGMSSSENYLVYI